MPLNGMIVKMPSATNGTGIKYSELFELHVHFLMELILLF